jgi:hypothetical protein
MAEKNGSHVLARRSAKFRDKVVRSLHHTYYRSLHEEYLHDLYDYTFSIVTCFHRNPEVDGLKVRLT